MSTCVIVPEGGLKIDGVQWPAGPKKVDMAWRKLLIERGAQAITKDEYEKLTEPVQKPKILGPTVFTIKDLNPVKKEEIGADDRKPATNQGQAQAPVSSHRSRRSSKRTPSRG